MQALSAVPPTHTSRKSTDEAGATWTFVTELNDLGNNVGDSQLSDSFWNDAATKRLSIPPDALP